MAIIKKRGRKYSVILDWPQDYSLRAMSLVAKLSLFSDKKFIVMEGHVAVFGRNYILIADIQNEKQVPRILRKLREALEKIDEEELPPKEIAEKIVRMFRLHC